MQIFRRKYLFNPQTPVFKNDRVRTYNCLDTQTKNNRLLILHHLVPPVDVISEKGVLQPIQFPSSNQPYSVYPLINCCSQIGKLNQNDAMYVLKCLVQCKIKKPLYYAISPQGICVSQVQGLLPQRSPDLFNLALQLLDLPSSLIQVEKSVVSKQGYAICRAISDNIIDNSYFLMYGWKDAKNNIKDQNFWIFKARRKEQGPFNQEYALAWHVQHGMCRFKYIDLNKDSFQEDFQTYFRKRIQFFQHKSTLSKNLQLLNIYKVQKDLKGIKIFTSIANQGNLSDYINIKRQLNQKLTQTSVLSLLQNFIRMMIEISHSHIQGHSSLHIKNVYVHNNRITLGQPIFITDKIEKKLRDLKKGFDYFAPEFKQNIILPQKLFNLNQQKLDIWSFGFLLHKIFTGQVPIFDSNKNPLTQKKNMSKGMIGLIKRCLSIDPSNRPRWEQINLRILQRDIVQNYDVVLESQMSSPKHKKSEEIRLDSPSLKSKKFKATHQIIHLKEIEQEKLITKQEQAKIPIQQQQPEKQQKIQYYLPPEISSKLKRIKLILKIIVIMIMYLVVFFGPFIRNSFQMILLKDYLERTPLYLVDYNDVIISLTTILTAQSKFFLFNDISFADIQNRYNCINDRFDSISNPNYSLMDYIKSSKFQALIYTGWVGAIIICVIKSMSIWKGGISNRPRKPSMKFWLVYGFHELSMASLLFAHFFIYQFFYFSGISPCLYIEDYAGVQPYFDSSLYLLLGNQNGYMQNVFSSLCILSLFLCFSGCFYAWGPKFDVKHFTTVLSILFRIVPYVLMFLLCRIGVFKIFSPTALNDNTQIIPLIISHSSKGFFGIIPEIFVMICIAIQALLQMLIYRCQQKASQSDSLSRMFNINERKFLQRNDSYSLQRSNSNTIARNNSNTIARNNSNVIMIRENSGPIMINDNSSTLARDNSQNLVRQNSNTLARYNSHSLARDNSQTIARDNSNNLVRSHSNNVDNSISKLRTNIENQMSLQNSKHNLNEFY